MKAIATALCLVVLFITSCATFDRLVGVADTVISIPTAREELEAYLTPDELATVSDELYLLDRTYQPIADAVYGRSDISLDGALEQAFKTAILEQQIERAYLEIRRVTRVHRDRTGEPIPFTLARVSVEAETLWADWKMVSQGNQRARTYMRLASQIAIAL